MLSLTALFLLTVLVDASRYLPYAGSLQEGSFFEQFEADSLSEAGWVVSEALKKDSSPYSGQWALEEAFQYPGFVGDKGLVMQNDSSYYAVSKLLPRPIQIENKCLVVQFEVKFQQEISCAGSYIKLLSGELSLTHFNDELDFQVRFGPDICGAQNKIDFSLMKTVDSEEVVSGLSHPPLARRNLLSNLYTLIVWPNRDMEIRINGEVAKAGNMHEPNDFMDPPIDEPAYILDPDVEKPADWDEREYVIDELAEKPADYDETLGSMWISNPDAKKPQGWNDDETIPKYIRNSEAVKPNEWNDEEDGEWIQPFIKNPECKVGCGKWEAPKIVNSYYKGEWVPPSIKNPKYKGEWTPPLIKNRAVTTSAVLSRPITAVGFDLWSMHAGILFNNIYVGNSILEAEIIGNETFVPKLEEERKAYDINKPKAKYPPVSPPKTFEDYLNEDSSGVFSAFKAVIEVEVDETRKFWQNFKLDPLKAIVTNPFRFVGSCFLVLSGFIISAGTLNVLLSLFLSSKQQAQENVRIAKGKAAKEKAQKAIQVDDQASNSVLGISSGRETSTTKTRKIR